MNEHPLALEKKRKQQWKKISSGNVPPPSMSPWWCGWHARRPLVKCDGRRASESARGSQWSWRPKGPQQQQLESQHGPKGGAQEGPAPTVRIIFLLDEATVSLGHYNHSGNDIEWMYKLLKTLKRGLKDKKQKWQDHWTGTATDKLKL